MPTSFRILSTILKYRPAKKIDAPKNNERKTFRFFVEKKKRKTIDLSRNDFIVKFDNSIGIIRNAFEKTTNIDSKFRISKTNRFEREKRVEHVLQRDRRLTMCKVQRH